MPDQPEGRRTAEGWFSMAMLHAGRAFRTAEVSLRDKRAAMLALSPKGTVPVLRLPEGPVIDESWDIMCWA
jgi:glutathione S-transferase